MIVAEVLVGQKEGEATVSAALAIVDASNLQRNLYLVEAQEPDFERRHSEVRSKIPTPNVSVGDQKPAGGTSSIAGWCGLGKSVHNRGR